MKMADDVMIVLGDFQQETENDEGVLVQCQGWVFCSKDELLNCKAFFECTGGENLYASFDTTFKLLYNGWTLSNMITETIVESKGGNIIPLLPLLYLIFC
jgi:hypothetical protein